MILSFPPFTPYPTQSTSVVAGGITAGSFAAGAIDAAAIAANAIGAAEIAAGAITAAKFAAGAVDAAALAADAVTEIGVGVWAETTRALTDKVGFSLTAGSYSVRASSTQQSTISLAGVTSATAAISAVTLTRATLGFLGVLVADALVFTTALARVLFTSTTELTGQRGGSANTTGIAVQVGELL